MQPFCQEPNILWFSLLSYIYLYELDIHIILKCKLSPCLHVYILEGCRVQHSMSMPEYDTRICVNGS